MNRFIKICFPEMHKKDAGYLANILTDYYSLPPDKIRVLENDAEVREAVAILKKTSDAASRSGQPQDGPERSTTRESLDYSNRILQSYLQQIFIVERAILAAQDYPSLIARAPLLIERFRSLADARIDYIKRQYDQELSSEKLNALWAEHTEEASKSESWLRHKLIALLKEIHWCYGQTLVREHILLKQRLLLLVTFVPVLVGMPLAIWGSYHFTYPYPQTWVLLTAIFLGLLGGGTSVMRRLQTEGTASVLSKENSYKELTTMEYGTASILISPYFGGIFAALLVLLFRSDVLSQVFNSELTKQIFPSFDTSGNAGFLSLASPLHANLARLFVWSFIAGFAEQLVPDVLDRLTQKTQSKPT